MRPRRIHRLFHTNCGCQQRNHRNSGHSVGIIIAQKRPFVKKTPEFLTYSLNRIRAPCSFSYIMNILYFPYFPSLFSDTTVKIAAPGILRRLRIFHYFTKNT